MTPLVIATALSLLALDAGAANTPPTQVAPATVKAPPKVSAADDPDKVICRREQITGDRFYTRVCMTQSQWDDQQKNTETFERRINQTPTAMGGGGMNK
jgi:hypothetical protein